MPNVTPFRIEFAGSFYTSELYDADGRNVFDLMEAAEAAEEVYGDGWACVYNGNEGIERSDYEGCVQNSDYAEEAK